MNAYRFWSIPLLVALSFGLAQYFWPTITDEQWPFLWLYFVVLSAALKRLQKRLEKKLADQQPLILLAVLSVHLFGSLFLAVLWKIWGSVFDLRFALNYLLLYVAFLVFEVLSLLYNLRPLSNEPQ
jgi:hypothetical protein